MPAEQTTKLLFEKILDILFVEKISLMLFFSHLSTILLSIIVEVPSIILIFNLFFNECVISIAIAIRLLITSSFGKLPIKIVIDLFPVLLQMYPKIHL